MVVGTTTIDVHRGSTVVATGIVATIDPVTPIPILEQQVPEGAAGETLFDRYTIYPLSPALPDIRERDQVVDTQETDHFTGQPARYYVRRVKTYHGHHLEIEADRVATAPTT
jgi:hypothetical protein